MTALRSTRQRRLAAASLSGALALTAWIGALAPAQAQVGDLPVDTSPVDQVVDTVTNTIDQTTVDGTIDTVNNTIDSVEKTVNDTIGTVEDTLPQLPIPLPDVDLPNVPPLSGPAVPPTSPGTTPSASGSGSPAMATSPAVEGASAGGDLAGSYDGGAAAGDGGPGVPGGAPVDGARGLNSRAIAFREAAGNIVPAAELSPDEMPQWLVLGAASLLSLVSAGLAWSARKDSRDALRSFGKLPAFAPVSV